MSYGQVFNLLKEKNLKNWLLYTKHDFVNLLSSDTLKEKYFLHVNSIENMISELPPEVMDEVEGDISVHPTKDGKIALIVGNSKDGFIEATYEGANGGYTNVMQDIKRMTNHMGETRDTKVDAGFMGRVASASRFKGVATPSLEAEISSLRSEVMLYTDGSPQQRAALDRIKDYQREVSRRTNDGSERSSGFSIAALTSTIADTAKGMLV